MHILFMAGMAFFAFLQGPFGEQWNKKSILTIDRQVELPGVILEPGTYVIRLHEPGEKRSVVQVLNRIEDQLLATLVAVPDHRVRPEGVEGENEFRYYQVGDGGPQPLQAWYYTGDIVGLEFVYPKIRALEIAKASDGHVMASDSKDDVIVAVTPNGKEIVIDAPLQTARQKPQSNSK